MNGHLQLLVNCTCRFNLLAIDLAGLWHSTADVYGCDVKLGSGLKSGDDLHYFGWLLIVVDVFLSKKIKVIS